MSIHTPECKTRANFAHVGFCDCGAVPTYTYGQGRTTTDPDKGKVPVPSLQTDLEWAMKAAKQDANFLISPRARERAMGILGLEPLTPETRAAMLILSDGGAQQGLEGYQFAMTTDLWRRAADTLGVFDEDFPR